MVLLMFQKSGVRTTLGCIKPWFNTGIYFPTISTQQCGVFLAPQVFFWGVDFLVFFGSGEGVAKGSEVHEGHNRERFGTTPRFRSKHILVEGFCLPPPKNTTKKNIGNKVGFQKYVL